MNNKTTKAIYLLLISFQGLQPLTLVAQSLRPTGYREVNHITLESGKIKAVFVDNGVLPPDHWAGYNGIAELYHDTEKSKLFVPSYAGFNLEHIFGGDSLTDLFEPRKHPMTLYEKSSSEVLLYQSPTPLSGVESLTTFKLVAPHYIDITFQCVWQSNAFFKHDYAGFFWASYIQEPPDKKIYFKGMSLEQEDQQAEWVSTYSDMHGTKSTHKHAQDSQEFYFASNFNATLASHFSNYHFTEPFYFGHFYNMALAYFFDASEVIRFSQSPTGGGSNSPAWDFQYLIPHPQAGKVYSFRARLVYKPFESNEDIAREYRMWTEIKKK